MSKLKDIVSWFNPLTENNKNNEIYISKYVSGTPGPSAVYEDRKLRQQNIDIFNYTEIELSSADILSLNWNTGLEILPALGVGQYYSKLKILAEFTAGATPYTFSDGSKWLDFYHAGRDNFIGNSLISGNNAVGIIDIPVLGLILGNNDGNTDNIRPFVGQLSNLQSNVELYFGTLNDAEITLGDGTLLLKIYYKIETFGTNL